MIYLKVGELLGKNGMFNITAAAKEIGITRQTLASLVKGDVSRIELETLGRICTYFKCQPGDVLGYNEPDFEIVVEDGNPTPS